MKKAGMSHIEVILAFIIFISAVLFVFTFFDIENKARSVDASLSYVTQALIKNVSVQVIRYSIVVKNDEQAISVDLGDEIPLRYQIHAENYSGTILPVQISATDRSIVHINRLGSKLILIYIAEDIEPNETSFVNPPLHDPRTYVIASTSTDTLISEKRIRALVAAHNRNYENLKQYFQLSPRIDFSLGLVFSEQDLINTTAPVPIRTEVSVERLRREVLRTDGNLRFADFIIRVW